MWYTRWAVDRVHSRDRQPASIYFHPWEIDPEQPRLPASLRSRIRHYRNLQGMEQRIRELLSRARPVPLCEIVAWRISEGRLESRVLEDAQGKEQRGEKLFFLHR